LEKIELAPEILAGRSDLMSVLPSTGLPEVLMEVHQWTHFGHDLTHLTGRRQPTAEHDAAILPALLAAPVAEATNLGLATMANSSGMALHKLESAYDWYFREETLRPARAHLNRASALSLVINAIAVWNTRYFERAEAELSLCQRKYGNISLPSSGPICISMDRTTLPDLRSKAIFVPYENIKGHVPSSLLIPRAKKQKLLPCQKKRRHRLRFSSRASLKRNRHEQVRPPLSCPAEQMVQPGECLQPAYEDRQASLSTGSSTTWSSGSAAIWKRPSLCADRLPESRWYH
jgi:hypothetical protein